MHRELTAMAICVAVLFLAPAAATAQEADQEELVVSFLSGDNQLNPILSYTASEAQIYTALYEGLVTYHPLTLEPLPAVAERWEVSPDGKTYTFFLRESARYWNGDQVLAEHFQETWLKIIDPETEAAYNFLFDVIAGAREYRTGRSSDPDTVGITAISDTVLEVELRQPATHFLKILCHHSFMPVHPSVLNREDWSEMSTVPGNGPYYILERAKDELVLVRNELYWDAGSVKIPRLRIRFMDEDPADITDEFNQGQIHWVTGGMELGSVNKPRSIVVNPLFATTYFFIRSDREPFDDPRIRRALALLLPWDEIRDESIQFIPATTLVPSIPYYPEVQTITSKSVEEARQLLEEAGYTDGVRLPAIRVFVPQGPENQRLATLMKESWEENLEVSVEIAVSPYPGYFDALKTQDYTLGTVSWIGDFADPFTFLQMWVTGSNVNDAGFSSQEYDDLIEIAMTQSGRRRYETMAEAEEILLTSGTVLPVSHSPAINLIDLDALDGWYPNPLDIHPFKFIRFAAFAPIPNVATARD